MHSYIYCIYVYFSQIAYQLVVQRQGEAMIVAGSAFHGGVNLGANLNAAINFATVDFIRVRHMHSIILTGAVFLGLG